jgi:hypothetical protein
VRGGTVDVMFFKFFWNYLCEGRYSGYNGCDILLEVTVRGKVQWMK